MAKEESEGQRWAKELVARVGKAIKDVRGGRSAVWLSDRTAELGYRVSPTVIAKLDSGHRGSVLSVPELIVLAAALDTSPVVLVYPGPYKEQVEVLPGREVSEYDAVQWFSALMWISSASGGLGNEQWSHSVADLAEARQRKLKLHRDLSALFRARKELHALADGEDPELERVLKEQIALLSRRKLDDDA